MNTEQDAIRMSLAAQVAALRAENAELVAACEAIDKFYVFFDSWTPPELGSGARDALAMVRRALIPSRGRQS